MIYLLDTDHLSIADQDTPEGFNLGRRLAGVRPEDVAVTIITDEEQMRRSAVPSRGWNITRSIPAWRPKVTSSLWGCLEATWKAACRVGVPVGRMKLYGGRKRTKGDGSKGGSDG